MEHTPAERPGLAANSCSSTVPRGTVRTDNDLTLDLRPDTARIVDERHFPLAFFSYPNEPVGSGTEGILLGARLGDNALCGSATRHHLATELTLKHRNEPNDLHRMAQPRWALETKPMTPLPRRIGGGRA